MKKQIYFVAALISTSLFYAQVIIGGISGTAVSKTSVLLEFEGGNKGIILPYTRSLPMSPSEGTLLLDASSSSDARVKYYNGSWMDMSGQNGNVEAALSIQPSSSQVSESVNTKSIMGSGSSQADGVLVLESQTKALLLPAVASTNDISSPSPGMIVFINKSGAKRLAVFNGSKWSYWKP